MLARFWQFYPASVHTMLLRLSLYDFGLHITCIWPSMLVIRTPHTHNTTWRLNFPRNPPSTLIILHIFINKIIPPFIKLKIKAYAHSIPPMITHSQRWMSYTLHCIPNSIIHLPYQAKTQYVQIQNIVYTSIKRPISG